MLIRIVIFTLVFCLQMNQNLIWIHRLTAFIVDFTLELNCTQLSINYRPKTTVQLQLYNNNRPITTVQ